MATVKEFEKRFSEITREQTGTVRYVSRKLQEAGLMPTGKRGLSVNAPDMTDEQAAYFALGFYGSAEPKNSASVANHLATLQSSRASPTLLDEFVELIRAERGASDIKERIANIRVIRLRFLMWEEWPQVTFYYLKKSEEKDWENIMPSEMSFSPFEDSPSNLNPAQRVLATEVEGDVFAVLADALGPIEDKIENQ